MAEIGGCRFLSITGGVDSGSGMQVEVITRSGVDGIAYRRMGRKGGEFTLQTVVDVPSAAGVAALCADYKLMQGAVVDIVDNSGILWPRYVVLEVRIGDAKKMLKAIGGYSGSSGHFLLRATWTMRAA